MTKRFATAVAAGLLISGSFISSSSVEARQSGGGRSGGGHASFAASAGGARVAARATGGNAAHFRASAAGFSFSAGAHAPSRISVNTAHFKSGHIKTGHVRHRSHGRYYGYVAALGIPLVSYAYVSNSYRSCAWLKERFEDTGLRKWRVRYEACVDGDDD